MSQGSYNVPTGGSFSMVTFAQLMNAAYNALATQSAGASAPANGPGSLPQEFQTWFDTTNVNLPVLRLFDGVNWDRVGTMDVVNSIFLPQLGGGHATIASAATTDLGAQPQTFITITGSATITSFGSSPKVGEAKLVYANGSFTITNGANIVCPAGQSITTTIGSTFMAVYNGAGQWIVALYSRSGFSSIVNAVDFGADPTGVADSTSAVAAAIAAASPGGDVLFPPGTYNFSGAGIVIGNGTSSAASTVYGVRLIGLGAPVIRSAAAPLTGYPTTSAVNFVWVGATSSTQAIININGPLQGWAVQNIALDGASKAGVGIKVVSAQFGECKNLTFANFANRAIWSTTFDPFSGVGNADSFHNFWRSIFIQVPATANATGIFLDGGQVTTPITSNTDYALFENVMINLGNAANFGVYLKICDSCEFNDLQVATGGASSFAVTFDYSTSGGFFPNACSFKSVDTGSLKWQNVGSPNFGPGGTRPNPLALILEGNLMPNPNIANTNTPVMQAMPSVSQTGQTAQQSGVNFGNPYNTGMYRINYYFSITTVGTGGTIQVQIFWNDGTTQTFAGSNVSVTARNFDQRSIIVYNVAANAYPFSYSVLFSGVTGSPQYEFFLTSEKLN